jgi:hypothetical protein
MPGASPTSPAAAECGRGADATMRVNDDETDVNAQLFEI